MRPIVEAICLEQLSLYLDDLKNQEVATRIVEKAVKAARVREAARKARDVARQKNQLEAAPLVGKLASCTGRNWKENELFIVEGDSAGGSAKQGRDRRFQAILPLRGKPLNAEKKRIDQVLANEEFPLHHHRAGARASARSLTLRTSSTTASSSSRTPIRTARTSAPSF